MTAGPLLLPKKGSWSTNKVLVIVGAAVGLVLITVLTVLLVSRDKPKPDPTQAAVAENTVSNPPKREPVVSPAKAPEIQQPSKKGNEPKQAAKKTAQQSTPAVSKKKKTKKTTVRKKPSRPVRRKRPKQSVSADELLSAGAKRSKKRTPKKKATQKTPKRKPKADPTVDDLLTAGTRKPSKSRSRRRIRKDDSGSPSMSRGVDADALLSAGAGRKSKSDLPETLNKRQVSGVMRRLKPRVAACYDKYKVRGTLRIKMRVRSSGKASGVVTGKFSNTPTGGCVARFIGRLKFPRFSGPTMRFTYPFVLGK